MLHARRYLNYSEKAPGVSQIALVTKIPLIKVVICHFCWKDIMHLVSNIIEHNRKSCIDIERRTPQLQEEHEELQAQLPEAHPHPQPPMFPQMLFRKESGPLSVLVQDITAGRNSPSPTVRTSAKHHLPPYSPTSLPTGLKSNGFLSAPILVTMRTSKPPTLEMAATTLPAATPLSPHFHAAQFPSKAQK